MIAPAAIVSPAPDGPGWSDAAIERLRDDLGALLAAPSLRGAHVGVVAIETRTGRVLFSRNANDEFQPASTLKLLVGSVALERLGPQYRFTTELFAAADAANGRAAFVLRAGGDPLLATADLRVAAAAMAGISADRRRAAVYVDASRFDDVPYAPGWTWDDFAYPYAARISAAVLDENVVTLQITPGVAIGAPASVAAASVVDVLPFADGSCVEAERSRIAIVPRATTLAAGADATADAALETNGCVAIVGGVPLGGGPVEVDAAVQRPAVLLRDALPTASDAIAVIAPPATLAYSPAPVWRHDSEPYAAWLGPRFWIPSDNLVAETLLKEVGVRAFGVPGTTANGVRAEIAWLRSIGVDPATTTLADGSGLSQYDRLTPSDALAILQHDWNGPNRSLVLDSLPVGGARGTIEGIAGTAAAGRVFAKTGSFSHVRALAGYLAPQHHGAVTFVFDVDDWNGDYSALAATRADVLARIVAD